MTKLFRYETNEMKFIGADHYMYMDIICTSSFMSSCARLDLAVDGFAT